MTEEKKREVQKTVVAFVAGLIIGGLFVWVFSSAPSAEREEERMASNEQGEHAMEDEIGESSSPVAPVVVEGGSIVVPDQPAGVNVTLGEVEYPTAGGWVVVHEDRDGELGNALGAARFRASEGLVPTSVRLLRTTVAGMTYHVLLYSENGDKEFSLDSDLPLSTADGTPVETSFVAQ